MDKKLPLVGGLGESVDRYYVNDGGEVGDGHRPDGSQTLDEVEIVTLLNQIATERAAREEAESLLVWAMKRHAYTTIDGTVVVPIDKIGAHWPRIDTDKTPAGILAALRRAMEGE